MDERLTISTPEQVAFTHEVAGIGSRAQAAMLDSLVIVLVLLLIDCAAIFLLPVLVVGGAGEDGNGETVAYIILGVLVLIQFLIFWGYYVLFEIAWRGSTPGKRAIHLRVIRRDGHPIGAGEAIIRNLVRLVDFLPSFYAIGLIVMFIDKDARRLGDLAASTIVVREGDLVGLRDVRVPTKVPSSEFQVSSYNDPSSVVHRPSSIYDPLPGISLHSVTAQDYQLAREVLQRVSRGELQRDRAYELSSQLAYGIAARLGFDFTDWRQRGWDPITFLQSVLQAHDARGN